MRDKVSKNRRKRTGVAAPEMRVVGIDLNPAPDGQERLRRLFTILASHFAGEGAKPPEQKSPLEDGSSEVK